MIQFTLLKLTSNISLIHFHPFLLMKYLHFFMYAVAYLVLTSAYIPKPTEAVTTTKKVLVEKSNPRDSSKNALTTLQAQITSNNYKQMKTALETIKGEKLTFKEKLALRLFKKKISTTIGNMPLANPECDVVTLKDGTDVSCKVLEINDKEIKYKKCENLDGPVHVINKKDVFRIVYANGSKEVINQVKLDKKDNAKLEGLSLASMILGILSVLSFASILGGIFLGLLAIVFGIIGLNRTKDKENFFGKGFAIAGLITGAIGLLLALLLLYFLLLFI